jgi:DNA polymerase-3 subunit alpha
MGLSNYFLVTHDFTSWARKNKVSVGGGRGSAAGALVNLLLSITNIDPILYDLPFNRFLNMGTANPISDIDLDLPPRDRVRIVNYLKERYGWDHVAEISTAGHLVSKAAIRDVGRVLEIPLSLVDQICKKIPEPGRGKNTTFKFAEEDTNWVKYVSSNTDVKRIIDIAKRLEGCKKSISIHAGGVIISGDPIPKRVPLIKQPKTTKENPNYLTGYDMNDCEALGLVKFDILRVDAIETMDRCLEMIRNLRGEEIDIKNIPLNDPKVFDMFNSGLTTGLFQFDSGNPASDNSMSGLARQVVIRDIKDLADCVALYRPGTIDNNFIPIYLKNKKEYDISKEP